jgi:uncharacterized OsmC-like protein/alpha/beta superfamily hydrolase
MHTQKIDLTGAAGQRLSGRLDLPDGPPRGYALFAHCFTCSKSSRAAVHIARALAAEGIGVLRFDFTGLGESEGDFADSTFSGDVQDLAAAARQMAEQGRPVSLLIGHSLGGAAVLAAAGDLPEAAAVAVIGAPSDVGHLARLLHGGMERIMAEGAAEVDLGGRPFTIRRSFVEDLGRHDLAARIGHLRRPLLILHAPRDDTVGIDNASGIFLAAKHPKSFVSLDDADHLLTRQDDARYAATVITAWASRYLPAATAAAAAPDDGRVVVAETGAGKFQVDVRAGGQSFVADEPVAVGGLGFGPTPHQLVAAGLGACTAITLRMYADRKGWPVPRLRVAVTHERHRDATPANVFTREIDLGGVADPEQRDRLLEIAGRCPVHRTLEAGSTVVTRAAPDAAVRPDEDPLVRQESAGTVG